MNAWNPLDHPISFAWPARKADRFWLEHVPFGMNLVAVHKPRVLVELGTHHGVSYCAFCQAVKALQLDTRCYAVDSWEGDAHTGPYGPDVLAELRSHHDPLYGSFSTLLQSRFAEAAPRFPDGSIDLLHLDGCHAYEAVWHDFTTWLPKLSPRGIVLVHDVNAHLPGFGVWRFWEEVRARYPHFEFLHGYGLGLLAVGAQQPAELIRLCEASAAEVGAVREAFYQLGLRLRLADEVRALRRERSAQARSLRSLEGEARSLRERDARRRRTAFDRALLVWLDEGLAGVARKSVARLLRWPRRSLPPSGAA